MRCEIQQSLADVMAEWTQAKARERTERLNFIYEAVDAERPVAALTKSLTLWGGFHFFYRTQKIKYKSQLKTKIEIVDAVGLAEVLDQYVRLDECISIISPRNLDACTIETTPRHDGLLDLHITVSGSFDDFSKILLQELPCTNTFVR